MIILYEDDERRVELIDYLAYAIFTVAAVLQGTWQGLRQIPMYIRSTWRRHRNDVRRVQKERVDRLSPAERRLRAIRPQRQESE